jgi:aromatic-L-amino-acid/L-tryptophan decarboxylase
VAAEALARVPGIEVVAPPQLSLLAFRLEPPEATPSEQDEATRLLLDRVNARGRVMLTGCTTGGQFLGRICVLNSRTRRRHVEAAIAQIGEEATKILAGRTRPCAG